ncbi:MAG: DUF4352 domain-containing protein [Actinomycetota bacterium]
MSKAGWYPSPENPKQIRYWDGRKWTEMAHDGRTAVDSTASPSPVVGPNPVVGPSGVPQGPPPAKVVSPVVGSPAPLGTAPRPSGAGRRRRRRPVIVAAALVGIVAAGVGVGLVRGGGDDVVRDPAVPAGEVVAAPEGAVGADALPVIPQALGEVVDTGGFRLVAYQVIDVPPDAVIEVGGGRRLVAVDVEVGNLTTAERAVDATDFELVDADGATYSPIEVGWGRPSPSGNFPAGAARRGDLVYEIPESANAGSLMVRAGALRAAPVAVDLSAPAGDELGASAVRLVDPVPLGEPGDNGELRYLVHEVIEAPITGPQAAEARYLIVDLEVAVVGSGAEAFDVHSVEAIDSAGGSHRIAPARPREPPPGRVLPTASQRGDLTFVVPSDVDLRHLLVGTYEPFDNKLVALHLE